jgi:protein-tyrosine phosphatase
MKICDLHSHVLPGVDHGAKDLDTALQMSENAVASEVSYLALTPHFGVGEEPLSQVVTRMEAQFENLCKVSSHLPIRLALGAEVHITAQLLAQLDDFRLPTINKSRYLLTEFPVNCREEFFVPALEELLKRDYIPLIAHPERYQAIFAKPWLAEQWLDMGCHIQLTGGSIVGHYGKTVQRTAAQLLSSDFVACVASDAHGPYERTNYLMGAYDHISVQFSRFYAQCVLETNPLRIWQNENL